MKKIFIIIMLLSIVVLSGCSNKSENNLNGKHNSQVFEIVDNNLKKSDGTMFYIK